MVPEAGLEPARLAALDFESSTSTNSITPARFGDQQRIELTQLIAHHTRLKTGLIAVLISAMGSPKAARFRHF